MQCRLILCALLVVGSSCQMLTADDAVSDEKQLDAALLAWRSGNLPTAQKHLTTLIDGGSGDARVFYYRGLLSEYTGGDGNEDFKAAARLEVQSSQTTQVNRSLEKTQGSLRARIEKHRIAARNAIKADPEAARLKVLYREALDARTQGDNATALLRFDELTTSGKDPRYFYMHGVTLAESGDIEKAKAAFADGIRHETTTEDLRLVSIALADVQGEIRRLIEEQQIEVGDRLVSRQVNGREIQRRAMMTQDQLLADVNTAKTQAAMIAAQAAEARRIAAAETIMAENKAKEALDVKISEKPTIPSEPVVARTEIERPEEPAVASTEPADPNAPVNPFLGGGTGAMPATGAASAAVSSVSPGPIDTSYLPAGTEYLMYVRPADLLGSGFVKPLTEMPEFQTAMTEMSAQTGFTPSDVDSITLGMGSVLAKLIPIVAQLGSGAPPDGAAISKQFMSDANAMTVVRTNKDFDITAMMQAAKGTEASHEDKTYYLIQSPDPTQPQMAVHSVDSKTYLLGSEPAMKAALARGAGEATNDQFAFVSRSSHMVQAFSSPLLAAMSGSIPDPQGAPPQVVQFVAAVKGKISGGAIVFEAGSNLKLDISLNLTESSAATEANQALGGGLMMAKQMAPFALGSAPPELQPSLTQAVNSLASSSSESVITASLSIPGSLVRVLKDNPQLLGPMQVPPGGAIQPPLPPRAVPLQ